MNGTIAFGAALIFIGMLGVTGSFFLPLLIGGVIAIAIGAFVVPVKPPPIRRLPGDDDRYV
jgi:hypothetical protein